MLLYIQFEDLFYMLGVKIISDESKHDKNQQSGMCAIGKPNSAMASAVSDQNLRFALIGYLS